MMRKIKESIYHGLPILLAVISTAVSLNVSSQTITRSLSTTLSDNLDEELYIVTDHDIYIAGEEVYLNLFYRDRITHRPSYVSKVAYISLLDHSSVPVVQGKIWLNGSSGSGMMTIPDTLKTGRYLISACTHWMRNFPPEFFSGKLITIVNPFINIEHIKTSGPAILNDTAPPDMTGDHAISQAMGSAVNPSSGDLMTIAPDKAIYGPREKVNVIVNAKDSEGKPVECELIMSATKAFLYDSINHELSFKGSTDINSSPHILRKITTVSGLTLLPEPEGHIISGSVFSTRTGKPVAGENIILSLIGKTSLCRFDRTDENGAFYFIINESGKQELVIQPLNTDLKDLYIELDNPFPDGFDGYDPGRYFIDTARIRELNNVIVAMQVQALYRQYRDSVKNRVRHTEVHDFYGDPSYSIRLSDFIALTSVREVFRELLPVALIETRKDTSRFVLKNSSPDEYYLTDPFVLVDGVPVNDHDAILRLNPAEIEKINILNSRYYISDICLDGIIDFKTVKGNLSESGINMPLFRQEFDAPMAGSDFYSPEYNVQEQKDSRIPDCRNTLYWNPALRTDKEGMATAEFYTSDEPGNYIIMVEGFTADGVRVSARNSFSVRAR
jgi:hypothetical protein